jgi:hypothetical protein
MCLPWLESVHSFSPKHRHFICYSLSGLSLIHHIVLVQPLHSDLRNMYLLISLFDSWGNAMAHAITALGLHFLHRWGSQGTPQMKNSVEKRATYLWQNGSEATSLYLSSLLLLLLTYEYHPMHLLISHQVPLATASDTRRSHACKLYPQAYLLVDFGWQNDMIAAKKRKRRWAADERFKDNPVLLFIKWLVLLWFACFTLSRRSRLYLRPVAYFSVLFNSFLIYFFFFSWSCR